LFSQLLPVSSPQTGVYGLKNVCLSVSTVVGKGGAEQHLELKLWPKEEQALKASVKALQDMLAKVAG
jgi:L-lactate dehydrogenase